MAKQYLADQSIIGFLAQRLNAVLSVFRYLGVPIADEKTVGPTSCLTFLGIELDSVQKVARLPQDKVDDIRSRLLAFRQRQSCRLRELEQLLGKLNFASRVITPAETLASDILIETDASGDIGHGAVYGTHWFADTWSPQHTPLCITFKELYPICIACATWGDQWCRKRIRFHTDNEAVAAVLKSGTSRCPNVMSLLRQLFFICAEGNFMVTARHIPGTTNILADALSRQDFKRFHSCHPTAAHMPTPVRALPSIPGETSAVPCTAE
ncbi:uncharacterized protein LOC135820075 [Sycon ciliatum]|uniref:uncharacterized protein LOC135820075 n=1 Tax=Sycon ciliatum TaxID=27933 RepID=UPI0031F70570